MTAAPTRQVLLMAHGWAYNHRFFNEFLYSLPPAVLDETLCVCLEAGYFPDQANAGLMIYSKGEWVHQAAETLHSLVLAHAELPWLGLGHSLGFAKLLEFSVRWHSLFSLHGFTHFVSGLQHNTGTPSRILARMVQKAEQNLPQVLADFHARCGHSPRWTVLDEDKLLVDLRSMQQLDAASALQHAVQHGTELHAWASEQDQIVSLQHSQACFQHVLQEQGHSLHVLAAEHGTFANAPARYTGALLNLMNR